MVNEDGATYGRCVGWQASVGRPTGRLRRPSVRRSSDGNTKDMAGKKVRVDERYGGKKIRTVEETYRTTRHPLP
jgi:hypothetical protein